MPNKKDKDDEDESNIWLTVAKLVIGAVVLIGGTGLALWYVAKEQDQASMRDPAKAAPSDWGIANDSPIHRLH